MYKKGLSNTISVMLLIAIAIAAVVLIWFYLRADIVDLSKQIKTECVILHLEPSSCLINPDNSLSISLKRNPGGEKVQLKTAKLLFTFDDDSSIIKEAANLPQTISPIINLQPIPIAEIGSKPIKSIRTSAVIEYEDKTGVCALSTSEIKCSKERVLDDGSPTPRESRAKIDCTTNNGWVNLATWFEDDFATKDLNEFWSNDIIDKWNYFPNGIDKTYNNIAQDKGYIEGKEAGISYIKKIQGSLIIEIGYTINDYNSFGGFIVSQEPITSDSNGKVTKYNGYGFSLQPYYEVDPTLKTWYKVYPTVGLGNTVYAQSGLSITKSVNPTPRRIDVRLTVTRDIQGGVYVGNNVVWEYRGLMPSGSGATDIDLKEWNPITVSQSINKELNLDNDIDLKFVQGAGQYVRYARIQSEQGFPCT